jgi:threonine synthase
VSLGESPTGLVSVPGADGPVWLKLEGMLPTGSFKDRGMTALVTHLRATGIGRVAIDSSGNAGAALAAYSGRAGIECEIHVPETTSEGKLVQLKAYGAGIVHVSGPRMRAAESALAAAEQGGATYASHAWSPLFLVGTRTFAFELAEQLGEMPDVVVIPTGAGTLYLGVYYGFKALEAAGEIDRAPRLYGVQSVSCPPLAAAFAAGDDVPADVEPRPGVAEGVMTARPPRGAEILRAARATRGAIVAVDDASLWDSLQALARTGVFVEPTSALGMAGYSHLRARDEIRAGETAVLAGTGNGLKATAVIGNELG